MVKRLMSHARRNVVAYLALGIALGAASGVAYSSIPDAQGVIHGCYDDGTGALRVIDTGASGICRGGETALDWNQQGQPGLTGHTGLQGPAGPAGVALTYGRSVAGPVALPDPGKVKTIATLTVPAGSYAIFAKAEGSLTVPPGFSCAPGTDVYYCNMLHNERRLASTAFGCTIQAGGSSDLGRANLVAGANALFAVDTVAAELLQTFPGALNTIRLRCLQYAGGKWPARVTNARLIAMKVDRAAPLDQFRALSTKIIHAPGKPKLRPLRQILK